MSMLGKCFRSRLRRRSPCTARCSRCMYFPADCCCSQCALWHMHTCVHTYDTRTCAHPLSFSPPQTRALPCCLCSSSRVDRRLQAKMRGAIDASRGKKGQSHKKSSHDASSRSNAGLSGIAGCACPISTTPFSTAIRPFVVKTTVVHALGGQLAGGGKGEGPEWETGRRLIASIPPVPKTHTHTHILKGNELCIWDRQPGKAEQSRPVHFVAVCVCP